MRVCGQAREESNERTRDANNYGRIMLYKTQNMTMPIIGAVGLGTNERTHTVCAERIFQHNIKSLPFQRFTHK